MSLASQRHVSRLEAAPRVVRTNMALDVAVTVSPKPGKEDRVRELIERVSKEVRAAEPETEAYETYASYAAKDEPDEFVVRFR